MFSEQAINKAWIRSFGEASVDPAHVFPNKKITYSLMSLVPGKFNVVINKYLQQKCIIHSCKFPQQGHKQMVEVL